MKPYYPFYFIYMWLIAMPLFLISTVLTAIFTIILSPILPNSKISYLPAIMWGRFCCYIFLVNVKVSGLENIDKNKSYVFTANHQSMFDILVVYGWLPIIFKWVMKSDLRKVPFIGSACASAGHIFINRTNPLLAKKSLEIAGEQLQNGNSVVIFPEGTRTRTGKLGKFKRGAFLLALELNLPIVPITLQGSFERLKMRSLKVYPGTITMTIHPPIDVTAYNKDDSSTLLNHTREIISSVL